MQILVIASTTFREAIRQPIFIILLCLFGFLTAASPAFTFFSLGEDLKMLTDLGLGSILVCGLFVVVFTATGVLADEIENKTVLTVLSKPVRRETFVLGKFLGLLLTVALTLAVLSVVLLFMLRASHPDLEPSFWWISTGILAVTCSAFLLGVLHLRWSPLRALGILATAGTLTAMVVLSQVGGGGGWDWRILGGSIQIFLHLMVLSALSLAVSTRAGLMPNLLICITLFLLGHASGYLFGVKPQGFARLVQILIPNLEHFNYIDTLAAGGTIGASAMAASALYAVTYTSFALLLALGLFATREVM